MTQQGYLETRCQSQGRLITKKPELQSHRAVSQPSQRFNDAFHPYLNTASPGCRHQMKGFTVFPFYTLSCGEAYLPNHETSTWLCLQWASVRTWIRTSCYFYRYVKGSERPPKNVSLDSGSLSSLHWKHPEKRGNTQWCRHKMCVCVCAFVCTWQVCIVLVQVRETGEGMVLPHGGLSLHRCTTVMFEFLPHNNR